MAEKTLYMIYNKDSPAGVCPSCARLSDQSDTDDGLVNWPCPTILGIDPGVGDG